MSVSQSLRQSLAAAQQSQSLYAIANASGVGYASLHAFANGNGELALVNIDRLAEHLGLELTAKKRARPKRRRRS